MGVAAVAILLVLLAVALLPSAASAATINVPGQQATINAAIAAALPGDTILVAPGIYTENVLVNKSVTLAGGGGATIEAVNWMDPALEVTANNALVSGFTVTGSWVNEIAVTAANGVTIDAVNVVDGASFYMAYGIWVDRSASTIVSGSTVNISGGPGIVMTSTRLGTVINNTVSGAGGADAAGIWIWESANTAVSGNTVSGPGVASIIGLLVQESGGTTVTGNTLSGCATGLDLRNVTNTGVHHNTISLNSNTGVWAVGAAGEAIINDNTIAGNQYGVFNEDEALLDCTSNWWGDATGPLDTKSLPGVPNYNNPTGLGNAVNSYVEYDPWATNGLTLIVTVVGNGTVTRNPDTPTYELGETVQLTPVPAAGWVFAGWNGAATGTANPLNLIMTGDMAVTATFTQATASVAVAVTAPTGTGSYAQGDPVAVTWTANPDVTTGEYGVWVEATNGNWYGGDLVAASAPHSHNLTLNVPVGTGYRIAVMYRPTAGSGAWVFPIAYSPGTFDVTAGVAVTVTAPIGTGSYAQGDPVAVTWTANPDVTTGEYGVWAESSNGAWYGGDLVAASAPHSHNLALNVPVGTGYRVAVMYRPTAGSGAWVFPIAYSPGTFDVTAGVAVTVTAPIGTGSYAQGDPVAVTWTASPDVTTGEYGVWAESSNGAWYGGDLVAASAPHSHNLALNVPVGTGYRVAVMYRPTAGSGAWVFPIAYSPGTFDVTAGVAVTVTAPIGTGSYAQGDPVAVTWTASPDVTTGEYGVWAESSNGAWYGGDLVAASAPHSHNLALNVPVGTGYRVAVMYRPTAGSGAWVFPIAYSPGTFDVF